MTPERWAQIKDIFAAVTELAPEERTPALIQACQGDNDLQAELERLLTQHDEMGVFLDGSPAASSAGFFTPGSLLANRYRIVALLGSGGMGEVYEAEDKELGGRIALKVVQPQLSMNDTALERFRREVQLARQVTHPNVCRVFDIGRHQQQGREIVFLTMEFVPGETLSARLKRETRIAPLEARAIALQLCQALDAAHRAGVLHRDFKPGNVMLSGSGEKVRAIVTDFGIARWIGNSADSQTSLTAQGAISGTPVYMSPEQVEGKELTAASDIYSLGLVLYEIVTGARPFSDSSPWAEAIKRLTTAPPEPRKTVADLDHTWNRTILQCLEREPARRYATALDVSAALEGKPEANRSFMRTHRRLSVSAALAILMGATGAFVFRDRILQPSLPVEKHIAVLPFRSAGTDPANQATAYGMAESLTQNLSRLGTPGSSTWVVPWRAVRERPLGDENHAGEALGANLLLTGEMERHDGHVRVATEVKDAATMKTLRSGVVDVSDADAASLDDKLLQLTAGMLRLPILAGSVQRFQIGDAPAPGAYEFYLEGRGYLLRRTAQDVDQAIVLLQQAITKDSRFALAKANLAVAYEWKYFDTKERRWLDLAKEMCTQALALNDKLSPAHLASGMIFRDSGDLSGAIQEFQKALDLDQANDEARNSLSLAYDQAGRPLEAETLLKETINRNPANWTSYNDLAVFYWRHQQYSLAEPLFRSAVELAPGNPKAFYNLGGIYAIQGKNKEAEAILLRAIAIKPTAGAYSNLGTVLRLEGRYEESAAMLQKAVELVPADQRLWMNLGNAYSAAKNEAKADRAYQGAVQAIQKALVLRPQDNQLLTDLAITYANLHQKNDALLTLAKVTASVASSPNGLLNAALVYELCGDRMRALVAIQTAVRAGLPLQSIENEAEFDDMRKDPRYGIMVSSRAPGKGSP